MGQGSAGPGRGGTDRPGFGGPLAQHGGELGTGPAAALLGQGLTALVLLLGRVREPQGPGRAL